MNTLRALIGATLVAGALTLAGCNGTQKMSDRDAQVGHQLVTRGQQYQQEGLTVSAMAAFTMALEVNPNLPQAHEGIGDLYQARGDFASAADEYAAARQLEPGNSRTIYKLGLMYQMLNRVKDAIDAYLAALAINPDDFNANLNVASAYLQMGQPAQALPYAQRAAQINKNSQPAAVNLAATYSALSRYPEAVDTYRAAAELGPMQPQILTDLADALSKTGRFEQAANTLAQLVKSEPTLTNYQRLGYAHFMAGNFTASQHAYEQALQLNPDDPTSLNGLGVNLMARYLQQNRIDASLHQQAVDALQKSLRANPNQPRIVDLLSRYRGK